MRRLTIPVLVLLSVGVAMLPAKVAAAEPKLADQCVVHVVGQQPSGELELSAPRCYSSRAQAMEQEGVQFWGTGASARAAAVAASFTIGYHCDGYHLTGACTSVVGDSCIGGWLNTSTEWSNRISSTQNGCPTIRHYDGFNRAGALHSTFGTGPHNLTAFNNRTSSLQYL